MTCCIYLFIKAIMPLPAIYLKHGKTAITGNGPGYASQYYPGPSLLFFSFTLLALYTVYH
jgi:hypothetical protein